LSVDSRQYIVREAGVAAGLGDAIHPHMLRHGAGYALINDGVDVRLVQEFLGHASITIVSSRVTESIAPWFSHVAGEEFYHRYRTETATGRILGPLNPRLVADELFDLAG
jgi:hypothetical protein